MRHYTLSGNEFFSYIYLTTDNVGDSAIYIWQRRFLKSKQSKESHLSDEKADGNDFLCSLSDSEARFFACGILYIQMAYKRNYF